MKRQILKKKENYIINRQLEPNNESSNETTIKKIATKSKKQIWHKNPAVHGLNLGTRFCAAGDI